MGSSGSNLKKQSLRYRTVKSKDVLLYTVLIVCFYCNCVCISLRDLYSSILLAVLITYLHTMSTVMWIKFKALLTVSAVVGMPYIIAWYI